MANGPFMRDGTETRVIVEFVPGPRVPGQTIAGADAAEVATLSEQALEAGLNQVREVVARLTRLRKEMPANVKQMQVDFGIKFDWEAGALLANKQSEASIMVKLTWDRDTSSEQEALSAAVEEVPAEPAGVPITPTGLIQDIGNEQRRSP